MTDMMARPHETAALEHWAAFGKRGEPVVTRWQPTSIEYARMLPFTRPEHTDEVCFRFDRDQTAILLRGYGWREMDDKWVVFAQQPDEFGRASVVFHRSWTGFPFARLDLQLGANGAETTTITWETDEERVRDASDAFALGQIIEVCRWVLGMDPAPMPCLPE